MLSRDTDSGICLKESNYLPVWRPVWRPTTGFLGGYIATICRLGGPLVVQLPVVLSAAMLQLFPGLVIPPEPFGGPPTPTTIPRYRPPPAMTPTMVWDDIPMAADTPPNGMG